MLQPTDEYEVLNLLTQLNIRKSPGFIDIPVLIIKKSKFILAPVLVKIFNDCIEKGIYPNILKIAKVIPLHKGGTTEY